MGSTSVRTARTLSAIDIQETEVRTKEVTLYVCAQVAVKKWDARLTHGIKVKRFRVSIE